MIRLSRRGARKQPVYRVVVIEKDRARDGRSIEVVGLYNPRSNPPTIDFKRERVDYWLGKGAKFSPTLARLYKIVPAAPVVAAPLTPAAPVVAAPVAAPEPVAEPTTPPVAE
jgi:small subunit ribosomal protein S16